MESAKKPCSINQVLYSEARGSSCSQLGKGSDNVHKLTSGGNVESVLHVDERGMVGQALLGCLLISSFQISSLLSAPPDEVKIWQAFP